MPKPRPVSSQKVAASKKANEVKESASHEVNMSRHAARDFKTVTLRLNAYEHARLEELAEENGDGCGILKTIRIALDNEYERIIENK